MEIWAYIRVSKDSSDTQNQHFEIEAWATKNGHSPVNWIEESGSVSGAVATTERALANAVAAMPPGAILAVTEISRIGRDTTDVMEFLYTRLRRGTRVITVRDDAEFVATFESQIFMLFRAEAARLERQLISERTRAALRRASANGVTLGRRAGSVSAQNKLNINKTAIDAHLAAGASAAFIGRAYGVGEATVRKWIKKS